MKKLVGLLIIIISIFGMVGCQRDSKEQTSSGAYDVYEGYLTIDGNQLMVDDFEFIDLSDQYWIRTLGLTEAEMPNGYYIYDASDEKLTFTLHDETRYNFYDTEAMFIAESDEDRLYTTTSLDRFLQKFDADGDGDLGKIPFAIHAFEDGRVISISEIFIN